MEKSTMADSKKGTSKNISIREWCKNLKKEFLAKSPFEKWMCIRKINIFLLRLCGTHFMAPNYKFGLTSLIPLFLELNYTSLMIYTIIYYQHDPIKALAATPLLGLTIPVVIHLALIPYILLVIPSTRNKFRCLYNFGGDFIYANSGQSPSENYFVCNQMAINLISRSLIMALLVSLSLGMAICVPIYTWIFTDEHELIIHIIMPFIDPNTLNGFYINMANQLIICTLGAIIIPASELITCIIKNNVGVIAKVIESALLDFEKNLNDSKEFSIECDGKFRDIILKILDFERYVVYLTDLYYWKFLIQPCILMYSVTIGLFLYIETNHESALGCAICCYIQLLILCDVGKTVDDANDIIWIALDRFPTYMLPTKKQKLFLLILNRVQNTPKISIGPFSELNYGTITKQTKMIYTYLMYMINAQT